MTKISPRRISLCVSEVAAAAPSRRAEYGDERSVNDKEKLFGQSINIVEMASEAGAADAKVRNLSTKKKQRDL